MGFSFMAKKASIGREPGFLTVRVWCCKFALVGPKMGIQVFAGGVGLEFAFHLLQGSPTSKCISAWLVDGCICQPS
jgi:hypothetical protein